MVPCFYNDNASQRISFPSAEKLRVRDGWYPQLCKMGDMIWELEFFLLHSFPSFLPFLPCWGSNLGPSACQAKALLLNPASWCSPHPTLTLHFPPVAASAIFPKCKSASLLTLPAAHGEFSSHKRPCLWLLVQPPFSFPPVLFSILFVIVTWCP